MTYPLHSPDFFTGDPYPAYKDLRQNSPVIWHEEGPFWALLKYDDIRFVSTNAGSFSSAKGVMIPDPDIPDQVQ
jgi:cytochrome P450